MRATTSSSARLRRTRTRGSARPHPMSGPAASRRPTESRSRCGGYASPCGGRSAVSSHSVRSTSSGSTASVSASTSRTSRSASSAALVVPLARRITCDGSRTGRGGSAAYEHSIASRRSRPGRGRPVAARAAVRTAAGHVAGSRLRGTAPRRTTRCAPGSPSLSVEFVGDADQVPGRKGVAGQGVQHDLGRLVLLAAFLRARIQLLGDVADGQTRGDVRPRGQEHQLQARPSDAGASTAVSGATTTPSAARALAYRACSVASSSPSASTSTASSSAACSIRVPRAPGASARRSVRRTPFCARGAMTPAGFDGVVTGQDEVDGQVEDGTDGRRVAATGC